MHTLLLLLAQAPPAAPAPSPLRAWGTLALMVLAFYVILILPRQREMKRHQQMISGLQKGDAVVTAGGLIGEIQSIRDDQVTLRTGTATVVVERQRIARRAAAREEGK